MFCTECGNELEDDFLFCTVCGKKQEKQSDQKLIQFQQFCTSCGNKIVPGDAFCTKCGAKLLSNRGDGKETKQAAPAPVKAPDARQAAPAPVKAPEPPRYPNNMAPQPQEKEMSNAEFIRQGMLPSTNPNPQPVNNNNQTGKIVAITLISIAVVAVITVGAVLIIPKLTSKDEDNEQEEVRTEVTTESYDIVNEPEQVGEATTEEAAVKVAEYDLDAQEDISMSGWLDNYNDVPVLKFNEPHSYSKSGNYIENVTDAELDVSNITYNPFDIVGPSDNITVYGKGYIMNDLLYIEVAQIVDAGGEDLARIAATMNMDDEYIIPDSDSRKLTRNDIKDLSLRELNYAKNEIYARHGRKFASRELQEYFGSKSWYRGTIDPDDFQDSMLSKTERENVKLIKDEEYSIDPNGYPLDQ